VLLVGDGMIGVVSPGPHLLRWTGGRCPLLTDSDMGTHWRLLRLAAVVEAGMALYLARRPAAPQR